MYYMYDIIALNSYLFQLKQNRLVHVLRNSDIMKKKIYISVRARVSMYVCIESREFIGKINDLKSKY